MHGSTILHYKRFVKIVHKIFSSSAHAHIIGEHKEACTFIPFLDYSV